MRRTLRNQKAEGQGIVIAITALLCGLVLFRNGEPLTQVFGGILIVLASARLLAWSKRTLSEWQRERAAEQRIVRQRARKAARKERNAQQHVRRQQERETAARAMARRAEAETEQQQRAWTQANAEAERRAERARQIEAEAERLHALSETEFRAAVTLALHRRGLNPLPSGESEALQFAGAGQIALYLPSEREARIADVERLENWRADSGAGRAWLIARKGFAPDAVRLLRDYPALTFADPYLLANWL